MKKHFYLIHIFAFTLSLQPNPGLSQIHSSKTTEFYLGYMENLDLGSNGPPTFSLVISADSATSGSILIPATGYVQGFSVGPSTATEIFLPDAIYYPQGDEAYSNTGIKVVSDHPISLYAFHNRLYFSEATLVLPTNELGDAYIIAAHADDEILGGGVSELVIEGTVDNTEIEITPSVLTLSARPPGLPFTISLDEGQLFQLQAYGDLTGTRVTSLDPNKKVAVFSGMRWGEINCTATSHVYDENYPVASWGEEYILVPFSGQGGDPFRVIASVDQTSVYFNGVLKATLNVGQSYEQLVTNVTYATASHPVAIAQFVKGFACSPSLNGDPSMLILIPLSMDETKSIFKSVNTFDTPDHFVNVVCMTDAVSSMTLDGTNISSDFDVVNGNPSYSFAQVSLSEGGHILQSDRGFQAMCYGFGFANAYTFNTGFGQPAMVGVNSPSFVIPSFTVFPNPMKDETDFNLENIYQLGNENFHLKIFSMEGKLLKDESIHELLFHLTRGELQSGVYLCQLYSEKQVIITRKLVIE